MRLAFIETTRDCDKSGELAPPFSLTDLPAEKRAWLAMPPEIGDANEFVLRAQWNHQSNKLATQRQFPQARIDRWEASPVAETIKVQRPLVFTDPALSWYLGGRNLGDTNRGERFGRVFALNCPEEHLFEVFIEDEKAAEVGVDDRQERPKDVTEKILWCWLLGGTRHVFVRPRINDTECHAGVYRLWLRQKAVALYGQIVLNCVFPQCGEFVMLVREGNDSIEGGYE